MATHSSILVWRIPWTEEPGGLQSIEESQTRLKLLNMHTCTGAKSLRLTKLTYESKEGGRY